MIIEIEFGIFFEKTREGLLNIIKRMIKKYLIEGIILGYTELSLILTKSESGIPFLNTTKIHVEKYYWLLLRYPDRGKIGDR